MIVEDGCLLSNAALQAGVSIVLICGGKGTCGKCRVRIIDGEPIAIEKFIINKKCIVR